MATRSTARQARVAGRRRLDLRRSIPEVPERRFELCLGRLVAVGEGRATIELDRTGTTREALSTVRLEPGLVGRPVTVAFLGGDPDHPVVLGVIESSAALAPVARVDGDRVVLEGKQEIELRCGKASIHLTADGRVTIRGADLVSRSSGANRIKGATVRIN